MRSAAIEVSAGANDVVVDDAVPGHVRAGGVVVVPTLPDANAAGGILFGQRHQGLGAAKVAAEDHRA